MALCNFGREFLLVFIMVAGDIECRNPAGAQVILSGESNFLENGEV
jgi:hypothetical protein